MHQVFKGEGGSFGAVTGPGEPLKRRIEVRGGKEKRVFENRNTKTRPTGDCFPGKMTYL